MDTDAVIARRPAVVLVDELAHTNVPGSRHEKRAADVEDLRAAGIDVITTVNIQHLESINDEVERITGIRQRETVPDDVVRTADQIQLVDMSPDALRRRMAHGNIYRAEQIDASLSSYFRVGNLTALRELALLWLADRVDDALDDYRRAHRIEAPWPTKERIVVAVTGGAESETLIRRGARLAQRAAGSELLAVHVLATDGLRNADDGRVARVAAAGRVARRVVPRGRRRGRLRGGRRLRDRRQRHHDRGGRLPAQPAAPAVHRRRPVSRIASLAGTDRRAPGDPRAGGPRPAVRRAYLSPLSRRRQARRLGGGRSLLPVLLTLDAAVAGRAPTSSRWPSCSSSPGPSLVALVGGMLPALVAAIDRVPHAELVLHAPGGPVHHRRARPTWWHC